MNPSDAHSHLATLRQLQELLDAGTLTPQEFEALKHRLLAGSAAATPAVPTAAEPAAAPAEFDSPTPTPAANPPAEEPPAPTAFAAPDWLAAAAPMLPVSGNNPSALPPAARASRRRNPLTLAYIIGGSLVLLGVVLYLLLGTHAPPDEHLTSTSQTATDSLTVAPKVGPQTEQITLPPAAVPETVRVRPATPPPAAPVAASKFRTDSAAAPAAAPVPVEAASASPTPAPTPLDTTKSSQP